MSCTKKTYCQSSTDTVKIFNIEPYYFLFVSGLADATITICSLSLGFVETRVFFFPFAATALLCLAVWGIKKLNNFGLKGVANVLTNLLVLFSFAPFVWNLAVVSGLVTS
jgi:hypothetical protein